MRARKAYRLSLVILGFASLVNVIVAIRVLLALRSPVQYNFRVIEPPVVTNVITSAAFDVRMPGDPVNEVPQHSDVSTNFVASVSTNRIEVAIDQYHFMRIDDVPRIRLNGQTYSAGDVCAYGRISSIFPERVYFDDGSFLTNSRRVFDLVSPRVNYDDNTVHFNSKEVHDERKRTGDS